jgi:uncharacterized protein (DUF2141 family)
MKLLFKKHWPLFIGITLIILFSAFNKQSENPGFSLTVEVHELRNDDGIVVFGLYNREDAFPDEHYKKYFKIASGEITNGSSSVIFENLPAGKYAVNILHDENNDGKIKKGFILPVEGIGFSNYQSFGLTNRPKFSKASFDLDSNKKISVQVIYL